MKIKPKKNNGGEKQSLISSLFKSISEDIAIDLGTVNSLVYVRGRGIIINEPSVVALNTKTGQILAIGHEAQDMVGRTPAHIQAVRPLVRGVVSDFEVTEQMLKYFIEKAHQKRFLPLLSPRIIVGIPCGTTEVERKAVFDATKSAGAREVFLIEEPVASAIGARMPIREAKGNFIIDIGGGTAEIAVISMGGIVASRSLKAGGDKLDEDIIKYIQQKYKLLIGERTAERIKVNIGQVSPGDKKREAPIRGRNLITGLPEEITVSSDDIQKAIDKSISQVIQGIRSTIEETPPELLADIMEDGIFLSGGGSLIQGLGSLITKETKIPVKIIEDPLTAVVRGGGVVLESIDSLKEILTRSGYQEPPK
jgi:rod shape-determining protein MreB and related proteins